MKTYKGNPNLKSSNVPMGFTKEQIEERIKCCQDPLYFAENYMKIITLDEGEKTIQLYDFQKDIIRSYRKNRYNIVKCSRQVGKSTVTVAYVLWSVLFTENYSVAILAHKMETAMEILEKMQFAYERLPKWMQQGVVSWNKKSIDLENGSKIKATTTSSSSARGGTHNLVLLEEFAFVDEHIAEQFYASVFPTISSGKTTKLFMISTPNGMNHFYKFWSDAQEGKNSFVPIEAHWSQVPGRDEKWAKDMLKQMGQEKFDQEFGGDFLGTSNSLIPGTMIASMKWKEPIAINSGVKIYSQPKKDHVYFMTVDIAEGVGSDFSAFSVFEVSLDPLANTVYKQVATFRSKEISDLVLPNILKNTAAYYNNAYILVEVNFGDKVPHIIYQDLAYENLLCMTHNGKAGQKLRLGPTKKRGKLGFTTTVRSKRAGCDNLKLMVEKGKIEIADFTTINELTTFSRKKKRGLDKSGEYAAQAGCHDDLVMTLVMFAYISSDEFFTELTSIDTRRRILEEQEVENDIPFVDFYTSDYDDRYEVDEDGEVWEIIPGQKWNL